MPPTLGVLVPIDPGTSLPPPESRPLGRAALRVARDGIDVVFGDSLRDGRMWGVRPVPCGWVRAEGHAVDALYDRYPAVGRALRYRALRLEARGLPMGNPEAVSDLCRDKLECQRFIEEAGVPMPPVEGDPAAFADRLRAWGAAFLKPRFGSFGAGVRRVETGAAITPDSPSVLQRAVPPPSGWAGWCARVLCQREIGGGWAVLDPVVRRHRTDPVVNAHRGADVVPAPHSDSLRAPAAAICAAFAARPDGALVVELGIDFAIDPGGQPWPIEVNGRPLGRLEALASANPEAFAAAHVDACARPLRYLASVG